MPAGALCNPGNVAFCCTSMLQLAFLAARAKLEAQGLELTAANIKSALSKEDLNKAAGAFRTLITNNQAVQAE